MNWKVLSKPWEKFSPALLHSSRLELPEPMSRGWEARRLGGQEAGRPGGQEAGRPGAWEAADGTTFHGLPRNVHGVQNVSDHIIRRKQIVR